MLHKVPLLIILFFINSNLEAQKDYHKEYYSSGVLKAEGWKNGLQKEGYWKFYYPNGMLQKQGHIFNDKPIKYWYFYRENGTIKSEGHFINGLKSKWWLFYDTMEKISHKCQLKNNKKNGYCLRYLKEKLIKAEKYLNGKKIKEWTDFRSFKKENKLSDLK